MSKLNSTKTFVLEDFASEQRSWIGKLIDPLNQFMSQVYGSIQSGLTYNDNIKSQVTEFTIQKAQVYPIRIAWTLNERPKSFLIGQIYSLDDNTGTAVAAHSISWVMNQNNQVEVLINGLANTKRYFVRFIGQV